MYTFSVMTRIIQRCFLVLAFTGILLSCAQETTVSGVSGPIPNSSEQTSPSAPEISFTSVAATSYERSSHPEAAAVTLDSQADDGTHQKMDGTSKEGSSQNVPSTDYKNTGTSQSSSESESTVQPSTGLSLAHSQGLFRAALQEGKPTPSEVTTEEPPGLSSTTDRSASIPPNQSPGDKNETTDVTKKTSEEEDSTTAAAPQSTETHSLDNNSKDSGESPVPSKEDVISDSSSDVGKNPTPEFSTTPSKVQTDEDGELGDSEKSATRKRSLNATNTLAGGTTVTSPGPPVSSSPETPSHASEATEVKTDESVNENAEVAQADEKIADEAETIVSSTATEAAESHYTINGASGSSTQDESPKTETTPAASLRDDHLSISSAALSSFSEESIHPSENIDTTAQVSNVDQETTTTVAAPRRSPESEDSDPIQDFTSSLVTFDPNGMTHNSSQDPDSVTFPPQIFHVDGMPNNSYLSQVDKNLSEDANRSVVEAAAETGLDNTGGTHDSSEREREGTAAAIEVTVSREGPDAEEEMSNKNTVQNTEMPTFSTDELLRILSTGTPGETKDANPLTDESEEMLNDSPDFGQAQNEPTIPSVADDKSVIVNKHLEMNVSNDIGQTTGAGSQPTSKAAHELDFSIDYQPEQSEFRPVTVTSPLRTSESTTVPPDSLKVASQAPADATTTAGQPEAVSHHTSIVPIVLPNPAPSVVNQSTEVDTAVPVAAPGGKASVAIEREENISNSSIAGVAVKTSVSVSLPLSKIQNGTVSSATGEVTANSEDISPNITGVILPVPIHVNKDADGHPPPTLVSTEAATEASTVSTGLKIRKPKLKIGGGDASEAPRTRKPFLAPPPKSSSTAGPPVSIFKNARTRMASITSSTTARPLPQFSTIRIHYASRVPGMVPNAEHAFTLEPTTTTEPTTTETEEPFSDDPFTEPTQGFSMPSEDVVTIVKIAGYIVVDKGLRWNEQLINRHSPQYKEKSKYVQSQLDRLFRTSGIGSRLWKTEIDGFSGKRKSRSVAIDFFLYIAKSPSEITPEHLRSIFHDKLVNNTFNRFTIDPSKTSFEILNEEPLVSTTEAPEAEPEPVIPQWAIAVIVVGAASLIFIVLFAVVAILGRHHMRRRYSNKLNDEDSDRPSDWESKMAAAYENLAADTIYDAEDLHTDTYKKSYLVD